MSRLKKEVSTVGVIISILLCTFFYLTYQEYEYTYKIEERQKETSYLALKELNTSIYRTLKRESQLKVNTVAEDIRLNLLLNYGEELSSFAKEYDSPNKNTILIKTIDNVINDTRKKNRYFHIENDANDIFVLSKNGVVFDKSQTRSHVHGNRGYDEEITKHFNKELAEQAINGILLNNKDDIFWRLKNTAFNKDIGLQQMDIERALSLPLDEIKDYEFLSVAYIDKYGDILGVDDVSAVGAKQDSRKLMIVQGFNLYEHIQRDFKDSYIQIEKNHKLQIALIEESRLRIVQKLIATVALIIISFFSMAVIQNHLIKERYK